MGEGLAVEGWGRVEGGEAGGLKRVHLSLRLSLGGGRWVAEAEVRCLGKDTQFLCPLLSFFITMNHGGGSSAQPSGASMSQGGGCRRGRSSRAGSLLLPCCCPHPSPSPPPQTHFPAPPLLPLGDALWGSGQFAYILIYKKLSALADSEPGLHAKELNNPVCAQPDLGKGVEEGADWQHFSFPHCTPEEEWGSPVTEPASMSRYGLFLGELSLLLCPSSEFGGARSFLPPCPPMIQAWQQLS